MFLFRIIASVPGIKPYTEYLLNEFLFVLFFLVYFNFTTFQKDVIIFSFNDFLFIPQNVCEHPF